MDAVTGRQHRWIGAHPPDGGFPHGAGGNVEDQVEVDGAQEPRRGRELVLELAGPPPAGRAVLRGGGGGWVSGPRGGGDAEVDRNSPRGINLKPAGGSPPVGIHPRPGWGGPPIHKGRSLPPATGGSRRTIALAGMS